MSGYLDGDLERINEWGFFSMKIRKHLFKNNLIPRTNLIIFISITTRIKLETSVSEGAYLIGSPYPHVHDTIIVLCQTHRYI